VLAAVAGPAVPLKRQNELGERWCLAVSIEVLDESEEGELDGFLGVAGVGGIPVGDPKQVLIALAVELLGKDLDPIAASLPSGAGGHLRPPSRWL
jgi:hypothetical protein